MIKIKKYQIEDYISDATQSALDLKADLVDGKVQESQLPDFVNDVIEVANYASLPDPGSSGVIYITLDNNKLFRWNGSTYTEIASGVTNLSYTPGVSNGTVNSDTGTDATIPLADSTNAGLFSAAEKSKLEGLEPQNLQEVTDEGATTTNAITVDSVNYYSLIEPQDIGTENKITGSYAFLGGDGIVGISNGTSESEIKNTNVTHSGVILEFPDKVGSSYTIATTEDLNKQNIQSVLNNDTRLAQFGFYDVDDNPLSETVLDIRNNTQNPNTEQGVGIGLNVFGGTAINAESVNNYGGTAINASNNGDGGTGIRFTGGSRTAGIVVNTGSSGVVAVSTNGEVGVSGSSIGLSGIGTGVSGIGNEVGVGAYSATGKGLVVNGNGTIAIEANLGNSNKGLVINSGTSSTGKPIIIDKNGVEKLSVNQQGELTATKLIKSGGTSSQFLMADGSVSTSSGGTTNLSYTASPTNGVVNSSTGTGATITLADATNAGLLKPAKFTVLENTSGTNTGDQDLSGLVVKNAAITGATKTKITYDTKGLVTAGADATTADIADSTDKRYQTDNQKLYNDATSSIQTQLNAKVSGVTATSPITSSGGTTPIISTSMATNKLIGRSTSGTGVMEQITVGSGLTLSAGTLTNTATPTPTGYYGAFQDVTNQTAAEINTGYPMKLGVTDLSNGVTVVSNSRITIANTGIYNIQWSAQFTNPLSAEHDVTIWLRKNGVDVPGSSGVVLVPAKHGSSDGHVLPSWNFLLDIVAGDYYEFVWSTVNTSVYISFSPAGNPPPSTASVVMTVTQQSGIMAGTGITAINSLTGAAQTLATNGSGTDFNIVSSGSTHTFNLPSASATNRGALSTSDWTSFNTAYTNRITSLTTTGSSGSATLTSNVLNVPTYTLSGLGGIGLTSLSSTATGLTYTNTTGVFSLTSGYLIPTSASYNNTNWDTAYTDRYKWDGGATGLTATTGRTSLGLGTFATANYPTWVSNTPFVKMTAAGTFSLDNSTYLTSVTGTAPVVSSGGTTPAISMAAATSSVDGYLTAANFTTFNNKVSAQTGQIILTSGMTSFTTPATGTLNTVYIFELVGGGGGGGGGLASSGNGSGGGAGGYVYKRITGLTGNNTYTSSVTVGAGGTGTSTNGNAGASTTLNILSVTYTASGGGGGIGAVSSAGGTGGTGTNGDINITGQSGGDSLAAAASVPSSAGGSSPKGWGLGGLGVLTLKNGNSGTGYGAGGSSGKGTTGTPIGGNGSAGIIMITWFN